MIKAEMKVKIKERQNKICSIGDPRIEKEKLG
jgi:hypothetical protein